MSITAGQTALASDFVSTSGGSGDVGKVPKLNGNGKIDSSFLKFGGTGADGALTITSGATNIDCAGAAVVIKNYTSISITGTASITFTNPHANGTLVIFKSVGNVVITTSTNPAIDLRGMGASATNYGTGSIVGPTSGASDTTMLGGKGIRAGKTIVGKAVTFFAGSGGGNGGSGGGSGGTGGRGGGGLYIECGGSLNITSTINASGSNGTAGSSGGGGGGYTVYGAGGGAGQLDGSNGTSVGTAGGGGSNGGSGGGGSIVIVYNALTANTGTYTITGGATVTGGATANGGAGGDGYSMVVLNTEIS